MSRILRPDGGLGAASDAGGPAGGIQIRCPRCQTPLTAQIVNVIDARLAPQLKAALVSGYLNRAVCPSCGAVSGLSVPLVYHDPDKELLLVLLPSELNLTEQQQQRLIGGLVQAIMSSVPPEQRKGYFLRPQTVLTMQRLIELVLEADGVTKEMIESQRQRYQLLDDLLRAQADPRRVDSLIREHLAEFDYAFFSTLVAAAEDVAAAGDEASAERLLALRDRLLQEPELAKRIPQPLSPETPLEAAIERLLDLADDEQALAAMVAINRPLFDYLFFQGLTDALQRAQGAGDAAHAEKLTTLRGRLLEETEQQDRALQAAQQQDMQLIEEILKNPDPKAAVQQHLPEIDTLFLSTLGVALQGARREGNIERSARLDGLQQTILSLLAEAMPPEIKLVNRLLGLAKPEDRQALLDESAAVVNENLVGLIETLADEMQSQGRAESVRRLQAIREEVQRFIDVREHPVSR